MLALLSPTRQAGGLMKRIVFTATVLFLTGAGPAPLPSFEIQGIKAGNSIDNYKSILENCAKGAVYTECSIQGKPTFAGFPSSTRIKFGSETGRISSIFIIVDAGTGTKADDIGSVISQSLKSKYGAPKTDENGWTGWKFKEGNLKDSMQCAWPAGCTNYISFTAWDSGIKAKVDF